MRSLLDAEGPVKAAKQGRDTEDGENCTIDLVIRDLVQYYVQVADGVYQVGGSSIVLA